MSIVNGSLLITTGKCHSMWCGLAGLWCLSTLCRWRWKSQATWCYSDSGAASQVKWVNFCVSMAGVTLQLNLAISNLKLKTPSSLKLKSFLLDIPFQSFTITYLETPPTLPWEVNCIVNGIRSCYFSCFSPFLSWECLVKTRRVLA